MRIVYANTYWFLSGSDWSATYCAFGTTVIS